VPRLTSYTRDGLVFDVRDEGPEDGDVVVLLHGFPQRASSWDQVAPRLHAAGLRTVAPDQRGYSPGARPSRRRDYRSVELEADVVALLELLDRPVHLVGHDWGAAVGWLVAAHHPELLRSWTAVSVPHPAAMLRSFVTSDQLLRSWYMGLFQVPLLPERLLSSARAEASLRAGGMSPESVARYRREIVEDGALPGGLAWYRGVPLSDPRTSLAPVRVPTTMVWSDGDVALGRAGAELTARHVRAPYELVVLHGVSHWVPEEAPDALADAVLARVASAD
jgi:pimeloyl-ACP methyl ester carboxylesterase